MPSISNDAVSITSIPLTNQGDTPVTPASGKTRIFTKSDGLYIVNSAGGVTGPFAVSAGGPDSGGWTSVIGSWSYSSANAITVPSGAAAIYSVGDKIKWTQTTVKYAYVVGVADTILTVAGDVVANAAITANYYSHQESPIAFPQWFAWTPNLTLGSSDLSGYDTARFCIIGRMCHILFIATSKTMGGSSGTSLITLPVVSAVERPFGLQAMLFYSGISGGGYIGTMTSLAASSANLTLFKDATGANFAANETSVSVRISGLYEI